MGVVYTWDFSFLWMYRWLLVVGLGVTLLYTVGSILAGLAIGLVVGLLRLAVKRMIPPFMNQSIIQLKNTSLVSTIAVSDLLYQGTLITSATYRPLETYTTIAALYFAILFPLTLGAQAIERR